MVERGGEVVSFLREQKRHGHVTFKWDMLCHFFSIRKFNSQEAKEKLHFTMAKNNPLLMSCNVSSTFYAKQGENWR